jgi:hypothetical protein
VVIGSEAWLTPGTVGVDGWAWYGAMLFHGLLLIVAVLNVALRGARPASTEPVAAPGAVVLRCAASMIRGERTPSVLPRYRYRYRYGTVSVTPTDLLWDGPRGERWAVPIRGVSVLAVGERRQHRRWRCCAELQLPGGDTCVVSAAYRQLDLVVDHPYARANQRRATRELVATLEARGAWGAYPRRSATGD